MIDRIPTTRQLQAKYRRSCKVCAKEYTYLPSGKDKGKEHLRGLYCSMACRSYDKPAKGAVCAVRAVYCVTCGAPYVTRTRQIYCKPECEAKRSYPKAPVLVAEKPCVKCGKEFMPTNTGGRRTDYCGVECKGNAVEEQRRIGRSKRRATLRRVTVESVDPFVVFERDDWKCQLCGGGTPKVKRGTYDDDAPELDHIIPLSRGGEHSYRNTQCSCRACNQEKSDKLPGGTPKSSPPSTLEDRAPPSIFTTALNEPGVN